VQPLAIDLFCGLGGWTEGLLAEGYYVVGFDNVRHEYGEHRYPAQLVVQDVLTLHGSQFKDATLIVASPPCQAYSWRAMPWKAAKAAPPPDNSLFEACFRIQQEAIEAAGHFIPLVVENVRGAQKWVGRSRWNYGSYHLWGDVPALMPMTQKRGQKVPGFRFDGSGKSFQTASVEGVKVGGLDWSKHGRPDYKTSGAAGCFRDSAIKNNGGSWFAVSHNKIEHSRGDDIKLGGSWFHGYKNGQGPRNHGSKSTKRKMASAMIAKIPEILSRHIARSWLPQSNPEGK
jgi:hypothetical protein